jgi:hypothetical protein
VSNIAIKGVTVPIFMRLGNRARTYGADQPKPGVGTFRNVVVSNIVATDCSAIGCAIAGLPGHRIENVTLSDISLGFDGGGTREEASRDIPEKPGSYPESTMFGTLGAYGFFCRHVRGLTLDNVRLQTSASDLRHAVVFDDVERGVIDALEAPFATNAAAMVRLANASEITIRDCQPPTGTDVFLSIDGAESKGIAVYNNNLAGAGTVCDRGQDVPESAVIQWSNHGPIQP